jgi:hypothetical protein
LTAANAYHNLVGVDEVTVPGWGQRVVPFDPDHSYLLVKLGAASGPIGDAGTTMPVNSPLLCPEKLGAIRRWIAAGAPENGAAPDAPLPDAPLADAPLADAPLHD